MLCKKCVLPEYKPDIYLDERGICDICVDFERKKALCLEKELLESEFIKIIDRYKNKGKYDCLVMCSGGKDSIGALYYMKKRYKLNPLVFTFDHGFENEEALANVRNAVDVLGVDWLYFKSDVMKEVFSAMVKSKTNAPICHICSLWYMQTALELAADFKISFIVAGWTKGQSQTERDEAREYASMSKASEKFIVNTLRKNEKFHLFPKSMQELLNRWERKFKARLVSPHWFLERDSETFIELLKKELGWKAPKLSYPKNSTNCLLNYVYVWLSMKYFGYTHYHIEMSKLIRNGEITRDEACEALKIDFGAEILSPILEKIGCSMNDL